MLQTASGWLQLSLRGLNLSAAWAGAGANGVFPLFTEFVADLACPVIARFSDQKQMSVAPPIDIRQAVDLLRQGD